MHRESIETRSTSVIVTSFKRACCELKFKGIRMPLKVVIICCPPYSSKNKINLCVFFEEFISLFTSLVSYAGKLIIIGDFNIHMDVTTNVDSMKL